MDTPPQSRVAAGRGRAAAAKGLLGAAALGAFGLFALLARGSHAAGQSPATGAGGLQTPASLLASLDRQSSDDFGSGEIAPATGPPQVESATS